MLSNHEESPVFEEFMGIPAHALLVHAAVVFVPLLVLAGMLYVMVPVLRARIGWVAVLLAVAGPVTALFAKLSGEALQDVLIAKNYPPQILGQVTEHQQYADLTWWLSLGLGVATGLLVFMTSGRSRALDLPGWIRPGLAGVVVVLGVFTAIYTYLTGETGAQAVWTGVL